MQDQKSNSPRATTTTATKAGSSSQLSVVLALIYDRAGRVAINWKRIWCIY